MIRFIRRWWYWFLGAPSVFVAPREVGNHLDWWVFHHGLWLGPYDSEQAERVEQGILCIYQKR